jgi:hypothetical protein
MESQSPPRAFYIRHVATCRTQGVSYIWSTKLLQKYEWPKDIAFILSAARGGLRASIREHRKCDCGVAEPVEELYADTSIPDSELIKGVLSHRWRTAEELASIGVDSTEDMEVEQSEEAGPSVVMPGYVAGTAEGFHFSYPAVSPIITPEQPVEVPVLDIGGKENHDGASAQPATIAENAMEKRDSGCDPIPQDVGVQADASGPAVEKPVEPAGRGSGGAGGDDPIPVILKCLDEIAPNPAVDRRTLSWKKLQHFCGRVITYDSRRYVVEHLSIVDTPADIKQDDLARLMSAVDEDAVPAQLVNFRLRPAHWAGFIFREAYTINVVIEMQILSLLYGRGQLAFSTPELAQASLTRLTQKASRFVPLSAELMLSGQQAYLQSILMAIALLNRQYHGYRLNWLALAFGNTGDTLRGGVLGHPANVEYSLGYLTTRVLSHYEREISVLALVGGLTLGLVGVGIGLARTRATLVTWSAGSFAALLRLIPRKTPPPTPVGNGSYVLNSLSSLRVWLIATPPDTAAEMWLWTSE